MEATELFGMCRKMAEEGPSAEGNRRLHELLVMCCAEGCRRTGGTFGNLFAQVDYLCRQHGMKDDERREMHTMRRHSNYYDAANDGEWAHDLRALSLLISVVFAESVPGDLRQLLPSQGRPREKGLLINLRYVRCIVQNWNAQTIQASTADGSLVIDYGNTSEGRDFGYLRRLLREGMQLNLLDCHEEKETKTVVPGMVIVEPDFLIDISSIAACFTNYGHHPLLYTVNRLKPKPNTQAVLLGNFAGTALDTIIHSLEYSTITSSILKRSFREQALRFCACDDFDAEKFKRDAATQVKNIEEAVSMLFSLPKEPTRDMTTYNREKALLEPSFVCERLGLQGRVDLMTSDLRLLVEQKSGRNPKIEHQSHDSHGQQLESHYVQLLLYYGILRHNFGRTDKSSDIRLLYSRYPASEGLMSVGYYQQLLREALRLRNQIVATELLIAREGFGRILPHLSVATIYKDVVKDRIFHEYVEPELSELLAPLGCLSPIEHAYFERMMTFVYREQACQKLGSATARLQHSGGAASDLWLMPLSEKMESGNIFLGLRIGELKCSSPYSGFDIVTLTMSEEPSGQENFRRGDMVYLFAYSGQPDVRSSILYKGTLEDFGVTTITVRLTNGQQNPDLLRKKNTQWAVEHASADSGSSGNIRGLYQLMTAQPDRRALLLGQRPPRADESLRLSRSYHPNYDDILLRALQARDYFLLVGPPGTGKTSMALRFLVEEELSGGPKAQLLLMSYTNRAVDEICAMLTDTGLPYLRIGGEASCDPRFRDHLLEAKLADVGKLDDIKKLIVGTPIIVGTTSTLQSRQEVFALKHFGLCIVDEASQILEPSLVGLLSSEHIDRFILIGDHKQLPAVVQQSADDANVMEQCLRDVCIDDCRQSLFERLLRWERRCGRTQFIGTLRFQGRMHPDVAMFPSVSFYAHEQLQAVPLLHQQATTLGYDLPAEDQLDELLQSRRVMFFDVGDETHGANKANEANTAHKPHNDKSNPAEARLVADLLRRIHRFYGERFKAEQTVGVIVPYRNQIAAIRQAIATLDIPELLQVSIDTVERYQGSQRDVIIFSFTVTHNYQLDFLAANTFTDADGQEVDRKLNVALTRARCQMLIAGCACVLRRNPLFSELIKRYAV